jgi:putative ABC transport system permease protein
MRALRAPNPPTCEHTANMWFDFRFAIRVLLRQPVLSSVALFLFIVGIGLTTTMFSIVTAVIVSPLPYREPQSLLAITQSAPAIPGTSVLEPLATAWAANAGSICSIATWRPDQFDMVREGAEPTRINGAHISSNFLSVLGVSPMLGRVPEQSDHAESGSRAILTDALWRSAFNHEPAAIGKAIALNDKPYTVAGVLPPRFRFPAERVPEILVIDNKPTAAGVIQFVEVIGRRHEGHSINGVEATLLAISKRQYPTLPPFVVGLMQNSYVHAIPLSDSLFGRLRPPVLLLFSAVGCILLIACINLAHLQLIRALSRRKEMAIRLAIGADRLQLLRSVLVEGAVLSLLGGAGGLALAYVGVPLLRKVPQLAAEASQLEVNPVVIGFCILLTSLAGVAVTAVPMYLISRRYQILPAMLNTGRDEVAVSKASPTRTVLVVLEVAISAFLLIIAGGIIRDFLNIIHVDPGFDPAGVLTAQISLPQWRYRSPQQQTKFIDDLLQAMRNTPGVIAAGATNALPIGGYSFEMPIETENASASQRSAPVPVIAITPKYLEALGVPLIKGRMLDERDMRQDGTAAVINANLSKQLFAAGNPIGRRIKLGGSKLLMIVGVVGNIRHLGLTQAAQPEIFVPFEQYPTPNFAIAMRSALPPKIMSAKLRSQTYALDSRVPVATVSTMENRISSSVQSWRLQMTLISVFAISALLLATVGVYGIIAYSVAQNKRSIGIRIALGAEPQTITLYILTQSLLTTAVGLIVGILGAEVGRRLLSSVIQTNNRFDLISVLLAALILVTTVSLAALIPAYRAARMDAGAAIRTE